jgi:hypothetical protein
MRLKAAVAVKTVVLAAFMLGVALLSPLSASAQIDRSRYMSPDEIRPGMKGFGRTVMAGTEIETFQFEVISVMSNAFYAKQDVILIRASGLNLEHSGIIGGMSGSPCYVVDDEGRERMIGAVAYGWTFNKDPLCGVQPITQMLDIMQFRTPGARGSDQPELVSGQAAAPTRGSVEIGKLVAGAWDKPIDASSPFSVFNEDIARFAERPVERTGPGGLQRLRTPVMISGAGHPKVMDFLSEALERFSMEPIASGGPSAAVRDQAESIKLEPGSVLCIPLITGDIGADALGTCTEVDGDRILGFGHSLEGRGSIRLPLATGMVHTVVPSVMRSNKLGASLRTVGTLWGDESSGIFGLNGEAPPMVPVEVNIENRRGKSTYRYQVAQDETLTPPFTAMTLLETIYAHSDLPREHTISYQLEIEFGEMGRFRTSNFTSQSGAFGVAMAVMIPTMTMLNSPFGEAMVSRVSADVKIDEAAKSARIDEVVLGRQAYKPGEKVEVRVRWVHYRNSPTFTEETYSLELPKDLADGKYQLMVGSSRVHVAALRTEKPHLFRAESLPELLARLNQVSEEPDNRLFLRLTLPTGGLAVKSTELPDLPSFMTQIYSNANRSDIQPYREALIKRYDLPFAAEGGQAVSITVDRRADQ